MTLTVSVSELRNNISLYLERVVKGTRVIIRDEKKDVTIAQITQIYVFNKDLFEKTLRKAAGVFSAKNHPEWSTKRKATEWLVKTRKSSDRHF